MKNPTNIKYSPHLVLTAVLSGGITIALSLVYLFMCIAAFIFRFYNCSAAIPQNGATYFWKTIVSGYIVGRAIDASVAAASVPFVLLSDNNKYEIYTESTCEASELLGPLRNEITSEYTVFVLTAITASMSALCLITAVCLITTVQDQGSSRFLNAAVFAYIASCIASLVVDLTTASHFGIDYSHLTSLLASLPLGSELNYPTEVLRQGAFYLMSIALKGYVAHVLNLILMKLLVCYVMEHRKQLKSDEHSIHKLGVVSAFDQPRKPDDNWTTQPDIFSPFPRGSQVNNGFSNDDDFPGRPTRHEPTRADYNHSNRSFEHSDSWQHHSPSNLPPSARPFSYLEDIKRPVPTRPPSSPAVEPPWRRDPWTQVPPVPVPDYSPPTARRLKSALKPNY